MILSPGAATRLQQVCETQAKLNDPHSGNGRFVRNLIEKACMRQANRLVDLPSRTKEQLMTLLDTDFGVPPKEFVDSGVVLDPKTVNLLEELAKCDNGGGAAPEAPAGDVPLA